MRLIIKISLFLFVLLQIFIKFEATAPAEGRFGLQDFEQDLPITFCGQTLPFVADLHKDLCDIERGH